MSVDLSNVNISLQQFQDISSGKYNAGEVKLASATRLGKMNHHVRQRFRNDEMISHQEVIAIKEALVEALSQHGVDPQEIDKVRRELGLAPDGAADRQLHARSIRPLSRQEIRRIAWELLEKMLEPGGGVANEDAPATASVRLSSGQVVSAPTGMSRVAFARRLEDIVVRLDGTLSTAAELAVRKQYEDLSPNDRRAFLSTLPDDPKGGFKARVVAVMILHARGFSDCETLSVPNNVSDANAIALAQYLADHLDLRGEALLRDDFFAQMKNARPPKPIPEFKQAFLPATTPLAFNKFVKLALTSPPGKGLPGHDAIVKDTMRIVRERLGTTGLPPDTDTRNVALSGIVDDVVDPMTGNNTVRLTRATLREAYLEAALETAVRRVLFAAVEKEIEAIHGDKNSATAVRNALVLRYPDYRRALMQAKSPAEAEQVNERFRGVVRDLIRTFGAARAAHAGVSDRAHRALAERLGISPETVASCRINLRQLEKQATALMDSILAGKAGFSSKSACETAFGDLADAFVAERIGRFAEVDALDGLPRATKALIKAQLVDIDNVKDVDAAFLLDEAKKIDTTRLETLLRDGAPSDQVYAEMEALNRRIEAPIRARLLLTHKDVGPDDVNPLRTILTVMLAGIRPGLGGLVDGFFARPDVKNRILGDDYALFRRSGSFNTLSTDPETHLDSNLERENLRIQSFFVAPRNAAAH